MDIRYVTLPNGTDTAEKAPYTGRIIPNGVANLNDLVNEICDTIAMSDARARLILNAAIDAAIARCKLGETVKFGCATLKPRIENSFEYIDEPYDPTTNRVIIECYLGDDLAGVLDDTVPTRVKADEMVQSIKFSNVMDDETQIFNAINGTKSFSLLGNGITVDSEGESVKLVDPKTGAALLTAEVDSVAKGQRAKCHFPASNVASGKYKVVLSTHGLIGDPTLHVLAKNVTYTAGEAPVGPTVAFTDCSTENEGGDALLKFKCENAEYWAENTDGETSSINIKVDGNVEGSSVFTLDAETGIWSGRLTDGYIAHAGKTVTFDGTVKAGGNQNNPPHFEAEIPA